MKNDGKFYKFSSPPNLPRHSKILHAREDERQTSSLANNYYRFEVSVHFFFNDFCSTKVLSAEHVAFIRISNTVCVPEAVCQTMCAVSTTGHAPGNAFQGKKRV